MAWDNPTSFITLLPSTGLRQFRFVTINTAGRLAYPALGAPVVGVLVSAGTTGSTVDPTKGATVQIRGVAKVEATASTVAKGDTIAASSRGRAVATTGGAYAVGIVVDGSSGSTNRVLSVLLSPIGTT